MLEARSAPHSQAASAPARHPEAHTKKAHGLSINYRGPKWPPRPFSCPPLPPALVTWHCQPPLCTLAAHPHSPVSCSGSEQKHSCLFEPVSEKRCSNRGILRGARWLWCLAAALASTQHRVPAHCQQPHRSCPPTSPRLPLPMACHCSRLGQNHHLHVSRSPYMCLRYNAFPTLC